MASLSTSVGPIEVAGLRYQLPPAALIQESLARGEGQLASNGALVVSTGKYTGRSPNDRYLVESPDMKSSIHWGTVNRPLSEEVFDRVLALFKGHLRQKTVYVFDGTAGADPRHAIQVRVITERASQNLFAHQMFIRPSSLADPSKVQPALTVIACPSLELNPKEFGINSEALILLNLSKGIVLIAGSSYSGEIKKSVFTTLNYFLPEKGILPMHCAVNIGQNEDDVAVFFGLSGTGKTSLSADPERNLVGDDEHGWGPDGIFNFEGGYYAKCIRLSPKDEPEIWEAIRFGAMVENVVLNEQTRQIDFNDDRLTENTRATYPLTHIPRSVLSGIARHPKTIFFLTADAFGVLPPIARLSVEQAQYHFISGYTSKLANTERGVAGTSATFSTCFGAPFMPRPSSVYAGLLASQMKNHKAEVFLLNTGWTGGGYGVGKRISIPHTRALVRAALRGQLKNVTWTEHPVFRLRYPKECPGVPPEILDPASTWTDKAAYQAQAEGLAKKFIENFKKFPGVENLVPFGPAA